MDNFLEGDPDIFIQQTSFKLFKKLNPENNFSEDEIQIEKFPLSGISNTIYRVAIKYKEGNNEKQIKINQLFFKLFGRISVLVDRQLETDIMNKLHESGLGPKIYETDLKTYRIEEFIDGYTPLERELMLKDRILPKMIKIFNILTILGEYEYYFSYVGNTDKEIFFDKLYNDNKTNFVNFTLKKMIPLAQNSLNKFKEKALNDPEFTFNGDKMEKLNRIDYVINNLQKLFYDVCPYKGILTIGHNDAHPLNILHNKENDDVVLCDYEYGSYNFIGFDIANYLIESLFLLEKKEFPFYQVFTEDFTELLSEEYFSIFKEFFNYFKKENSKYFTSLENYEKLIEYCETRDYYYRVMGLSSLMWFVFAVIYFDYDSIKNKAGYDYFEFSIHRLSVYDKCIRYKI